MAKAKCQDCGKVMLDADGCDLSHIKIDGRWYERSTEHWQEPGERCHDCAAKYGQYHHFGCDVERCPKCGNQIISCGCVTDDTLELRRD